MPKPPQEQLHAKQGLSALNRSRILLEAIGKQRLTAVAGSLQELLHTAVAIYEANGDYAVALPGSGYCKALHEASRRLADTADDAGALASGLWHCHESCWNQAARVALETGRPMELQQCMGGISVYAVPIAVDDEVIGGISMGYGTPPRDERGRATIAQRYGLQPQQVARVASAHRPQPEHIIAHAKGQLRLMAQLLADIYSRHRRVQALKESQVRLQHLAHHDSLTGLPNRLLFYDRLHLAIIRAHRAGRQVALLLLDVDRFKIINDTLGHDVGDGLLREVARRLHGTLREGDTVARLGGDEFVVMLEQRATTGDVAQVAAKLLQVLAVPVLLGERQLQVTASIGVSIYPEDAVDMEGLLKCADTAMYRAKDEGRNNFQFFSWDMMSLQGDSSALEVDLHEALIGDQLVLHYQPRFALESGYLVGAEALLRWYHPRLGMIEPADFLPLAERTGLILAIGEWVMSSACRQNRAWQQAGRSRIRVSVNLSERQFRQDGLVDMVATALREADLSPAHLELELKESCLMGDTASAMTTLAALRSMGVSLVVDDFGTGYSSLSYLRRFPVHKLKIDRSLVRDLTTDPNDAAVAASAVALAHTMRLRVVAAGVETQDQLRLLQRQGCDEGQGLFYGRPVPAEEFEQFCDGLAQFPAAG